MCTATESGKENVALRLSLTSPFGPRADAAETFGQLKQRICAALGVPPAKARAAVSLSQSITPGGRRAEPAADAAVMAALAGKHWSDDALLSVNLAQPDSDAEEEEEEGAGADADDADGGSGGGARTSDDWRKALPPPALTAVHRVRCGAAVMPALETRA
jgi:hypothetical protein